MTRKVAAMHLGLPMHVILATDTQSHLKPGQPVERKLDRTM